MLNLPILPPQRPRGGLKDTINRVLQRVERLPVIRKIRVWYSRKVTVHLPVVPVLSGLALLVVMFLAHRWLAPTPAILIPEETEGQMMILDCFGEYTLKKGDVDFVLKIDSTSDTPPEITVKPAPKPNRCKGTPDQIPVEDVIDALEDDLAKNWHPETQYVTAYKAKKGGRVFDERGRMIITKEWLMRFAPVMCYEAIKFNVPASVTMAQAYVESYAGLSNLAVSTHNMFGNKHFPSKFDANDEVAKFWLSEFRVGSKQAFDDYPTDKFIIFKSYWASIRFHSKFISVLRYNDLKRHNGKPNTFQKWAYGLKSMGYATDREYPNRLMSAYKNLDLQELDAAVKRVKKKLKI